MTTQHALTLDKAADTNLHSSSSRPFDDLGVLGEVVDLAPNNYKNQNWCDTQC